MNFISGLIVGLIIGAMIVYLTMGSKKTAETKPDSSTEKSNGAGNPNPAVETRKENMAKLEEFIRAKSTADKITNDQIQEFLGVSDATATRYLDDLEKQGKIHQVGATGHEVYYTRDASQ